MKTEVNLNADYQKMQKYAIEKDLVSTQGIWIDGQTHWLQNGYEKLIPNQSLSIHIKKVEKHSKVNYNEIYVRNHSNKTKQLKIILLHHFQQSIIDHVSFVSPTDNLIFHSTNKSLYLVNGECNGLNMEQRTIQPIWNIHTDHMWSCISKGMLKYQPMGKGTAVSIFTLNMKVEPHTSNISRAWVIRGENKKELMDLNTVLLKSH